MPTIREDLAVLVKKAFASAGYEDNNVAVSLGGRRDLGQYQCNDAFRLAKEHKMPPLQLAEAVASELASYPEFLAVSASAPGFINLTVTNQYLLARVNALAEQELTEMFPPREETLVLDYGGPNVAKPLHIGHLRSAVVGQAFANLARRVGYHVIGDVHLGDWGLQMGLVITQMEDTFPQLFEPEGKALTIKALGVTAQTLNEIYPTASARSKEDESFLERARTATRSLQQGHARYLEIWKQIVEISVENVRGTYDMLGVHFDLWYGESDGSKYIEPLMERLEQKKLLSDSQGAVVVVVEEESDKKPMPPVIVKKSNQSDLYATTDLATIIQREKDFAPDKIWYVVDYRQGLHFEQVFRVARKAELIPEEAELFFIGFGTINGTDNKPYKTRDGGVMSLDEFLGIVISATAEKLEQSAYVSPEERELSARKIALAAVKFGDLINHHERNYMFDVESFTSFEGKTGPYILYMVSRIHSLLERNPQPTEGSRALEEIHTPIEEALLILLLEMQDTLATALEQKALNGIADYVYQIAALFSRFYGENRILQEENRGKKADWLSLSLLTQRVLVSLLDVLGIESVTNM